MTPQELQTKMAEYSLVLEEVLRKTFEDTRLADEAEFYASLLKHANLSPWDDRDTLRNIEQLIKFIYEGLTAQKISAEDSLRLMLLLYCHIFEWSEMYNLFFDLSMIKNGARAGNYIENPEEDREKYWEQLKNIVNKDLTPERTKQALALLQKADGGPVSINKKIQIISGEDTNLAKILSDLFDSTLRNGFSHNNYSFTNDGLTVIDETSKKSVHYSFEELNLIVNQTKAFVGIFIMVWREYLENLRSAHLKGQYCEYEVEYISGKFRIHLINGSIPLGPAINPKT